MPESVEFAGFKTVAVYQGTENFLSARNPQHPNTLLCLGHHAFCRAFHGVQRRLPAFECFVVVFLWMFAKACMMTISQHCPPTARFQLHAPGDYKS